MAQINPQVPISFEQSLLDQQQEQVNRHFTEESAYWRKIYQRRDVGSAAYQLRRSIVLNWIDALALPPGSRVLEVGCGAGLMTLALAQRRFAVTALDAVPAMIDQTRWFVAKAGFSGTVRTALGDVHQLSLRDNSFSLVIALGVIPWLHSPDDAVREMARVLKPRGSLVASADNHWRMNYCLDPFRFPALKPVRKTVRRALERQGLWREFPATPHSQAHSINEFDGLLAGAGLSNERRKTFGFGPFTFLNCSLLPNSAGMKIHQWLQSLADQEVPVIRSAGNQYLVMARKKTLKFGLAEEEMDTPGTTALSA